VLILQQQIVDATKQNNTKQMIKLQMLLVNSFARRASAVRQVTSSSGSKTPGCDGIV
jgi:RNA-directed DNA polymerase